MFRPRHVLAATDFSEPSRVAMRMAGRLAAHYKAELHILHAEDPLLCAAARMNHVDLAREAREELTEFLRGCTLPSTLVTHMHVMGGPAAEVICDIALREHADVIVVGARGLSGFERVVFGSTAEGVLRRSEVPVLLVPDTWLPPSPAGDDLSGAGPVVVGVDFTCGSYNAVGAGFALARTLATSLELLHVIPELPAIERWRAHATQATAAQREHAYGELARLARAIGEGVPVSTRVETGAVAETIADVTVHESRHTILVLGRRLPRMCGDAPGAIASRVASLAHVPTLMFMERETAN